MMGVWTTAYPSREKTSRQEDGGRGGVYFHLCFDKSHHYTNRNHHRGNEGGRVGEQPCPLYARTVVISLTWHMQVPMKGAPQVLFVSCPTGNNSHNLSSAVAAKVVQISLGLVAWHCTLCTKTGGPRRLSRDNNTLLRPTSTTNKKCTPPLL